MKVADIILQSFFTMAFIGIFYMVFERVGIVPIIGLYDNSADFIADGITRWEQLGIFFLMVETTWLISAMLYYKLRRQLEW